MEYLSGLEVMTIRRRIARQMEGVDFGHIEALRPDAMESAVARQWAGFGSTLKHRKVNEVGATLFYGLTMNHAFENGNKRTALVSLLVLLNRNKTLLVNTNEKELFEFARQVAGHEIELPAEVVRDADREVAAIASWLAPRTRQLQRGDKHVQFSVLKKQLEQQGCVFDKHKNNYIKVHRSTPEGNFSHRMGYPKSDFNVGFADVKRIRNHLHLDEPNGVDSAAFYDDLEPVVDVFVNEHRQVLDWLAET